MHIAEKYQQLARDAQASGDRVMSENYNQHAEHYLRIVAAHSRSSSLRHSRPCAQTATKRQVKLPTERMAPRTPVNGSERPSQERAAADGDVVDANSPQPFIEDMPVIDQEGQVNGAGQKADAETAMVMTRRAAGTRTSRSRAPRRASGDQTESMTEATPEGGESPVEASEDEQAKPRRRTTRTRRPKTSEDASAETAAASD